MDAEWQTYDEGVVHEPPRKLRDEASKLWRREHPVLEYADEAMLTWQQVGALHRARQQCWRLGHVPPDDKLRKLVGMTEDEWAANHDDLADHFAELPTYLAGREAAIEAYEFQRDEARKRQARRRAKARQADLPAD
jgi:hypothetical protein